MRVRVYVADGGEQYEAGQLVLSQDERSIAIVPATEDEGDRTLLENVASESIYVLVDGREREIDPATHPKAFLHWAHRAYTGTVLRVSAPEE